MAKQATKTQETSSDLFNRMQATANAKRGGIGKVYTNTTEAIGELADTVGSMATAAKNLADNAVMHTVVSKVETSTDLFSAMGVQANTSSIEESAKSVELAQMLTKYFSRL